MKTIQLKNAVLRHLVQFGSSFAHLLVSIERVSSVYNRMVIEVIDTKRFYEVYYPSNDEIPFEYNGSSISLDEVFPHEVTIIEYTQTPN